MRRITVLFGNYGSGKTELALNIALSLARAPGDVTLVDLDIVNPYFRSSEHAAMLRGQGIRVIAPVYAGTAVDSPALPPDVFAAFSGGRAVFDCGGDPVGAAALGSLKKHFDAVRADTQALFVLNTRRPFQDSAAALAMSVSRIQDSARLMADGFVLNTNLGAETTGEELAEGYEVARELAGLTGIPIKYVSGTQAALDVFHRSWPQCEAEPIVITLYTRPEWLS